MAKKDDTCKYPVMDLSDIPEKTSELVDKKLQAFEKRQVERDQARDLMWESVAKRGVNTQAGLRILYLIVGGMIVSLLLTGC